MSQTRAKVDSLRERIKESKDLSDQDRGPLLEFSDRMYLLNSVYSDHRHEKLLRHCTRIAEEVGDITKARESRSKAEEIVRWINQTYDNEYTNHDYRTALRILAAGLLKEMISQIV